MTQTLAVEARPSAPARALSDCWVLTGRTLRHLARNPEQSFQVIALPIILLLLFRFLLGGAIDTGGLSYVNFLIAGLIVISIAYNSTMTSVGVAGDLRNGIVERFRSMPMLGPAVLVGHTVSGVLRNAISAVIVLVLGLAVGFRPSAGFLDWLAAAGILLLFAVALSCLATILGIVAKTVEGASGFSMILVFVPYASSALVPTRTMPGVLRAVVEHQPVTPVIDALRALLIGSPVGASGWVAVVWWAAILVLSACFAVRLFNRRFDR